MKTFIGSLSSVGLVGLFATSLAACSKNEPTPAAGPVGVSDSRMTARASVAQATPQIAAAECEREMKCNNIGESMKFSSLEHCKTVKTEELFKDFNDDEDCRNGISQKDLDECVAKTTAETCTGLSSVMSDIERSAECGSADLCMD